MLLQMEQLQSSMAQVSEQAKTLGTCIARLQGLTITLRRQCQTAPSTPAALAAGDLRPSDKTLVLQLVLGHVAEQLPELLGSSPLLKGLPNVGRVASALGGLVGLGSRAGPGFENCSSRQLSMGNKDALASEKLQHRSISAGAGLRGGHLSGVLDILEPWPEGKEPAAFVGQLDIGTTKHDLANQASADYQLNGRSASSPAAFALIAPATTEAAGSGGLGSGGGKGAATTAAASDAAAGDACERGAPACATTTFTGRWGGPASDDGVDEDWGSWGWVGECQRRSSRSSLCGFIPWLSAVRSAKSLDLKR